MARFRIDHPAPPGGWDEVRPRLETALADDLPFRLDRRWVGEALHLEGSGAIASIRVVDGHVRAEGDLRPPASFFHAIVVRELRAAMERAWPVGPLGGNPDGIG